MHFSYLYLFISKKCIIKLISNNPIQLGACVHNILIVVCRVTVTQYRPRKTCSVIQMLLKIVSEIYYIIILNLEVQIFFRKKKRKVSSSNLGVIIIHITTL